MHEGFQQTLINHLIKLETQLRIKSCYLRWFSGLNIYAHTLISAGVSCISGEGGNLDLMN